MSRKLLIDGDYLVFSAAPTVEIRWVELTHLETNEVFTYKNRTEAKEDLESDLSYYTIKDCRKLEGGALQNALHIIKLLIKKAINTSGCKDYQVYLGNCPSWRIAHSRMLEYKGNRKDQLKPLLFDQVRQYLITKHNAILVSDGNETDDVLVMKAYNTNNIIVGVDKDYYGVACHFLNLNRCDEGVVDCRGLGDLWLDSKGKVRGRGRKFFYWQVLSGDTADNYKLSCLSKLSYGDKTAYKDLVNCADDKECWQVMVRVCKKLYPTCAKFTAWNGEQLTYSWLDCLQEQVDMAHMRRFDGDRVVVQSLLEKLGVSEDGT